MKLEILGMNCMFTGNSGKWCTADIESERLFLLLMLLFNYYQTAGSPGKKFLIWLKMLRFVYTSILLMSPFRPYTTAKVMRSSSFWIILKKTCLPTKMAASAELTSNLILDLMGSSLWKYLLSWNQTLSEWSLGGPFFRILFMMTCSIRLLLTNGLKFNVSEQPYAR